MLGHVAAVGARITLAAEHVEKDVFQRHAERIRNGLFAIVGEKPVVARFQHHHRTDLRLLVAACGCQKRNFSLPREDLQPFLDVIDAHHLLVEFKSDGVGNDLSFRLTA